MIAIPVDNIVVGQRHRQDMGDLQLLADSISAIGLLQPIGVTSNHELVFGERRYRAVRDILGWAEIPARIIDVPSIVEGEYAENEIRKDFSLSERVAIGKAVEVELGRRAGRPKARANIVENFPQLTPGMKTRDIAAERAGFGNPRTYEQAKSVIDHGAPELVTAVEQGKVAVSTAATITALPAEEQAELVARGEKEIIATANRLKAQAKAKKQKERQEEIARVAARLTDDPPGVTLICDDFRNVWLPTNKIEEASIDFIITDPPYDKGSVGMFASLSEFAAEVLKPTGSLLCMAGQTYLPGVVENLTRYLEYYWTLAYTTPGGQSPQIWPRFVNTFWKPVFWYVPKTAGKQDREWIGDVIKSDANDKRFHKWGQSESGMFALMSKFVKPGQTILDPFCGGGTTAVVAIALGCNFIGIDVDQASIDTTRVRLSEMQNDSL